MSVRRRSIKLFEHERSLLIKLYVKRRTPIEQFERLPEELADFTKQWCTLSNRDDAATELIHYMRTQRKRGLWVRLDGKHRPSPDLPVFSPEETEDLMAIFESNISSIGYGSDELAYDPQVAENLAKEFYDSTGRWVEPSDVVAKLTALRKRGLLPKVIKPPEDGAFGDIDQATG